nr:E3 ubiquitin-protein ligase At4g11680-like [Ipomoea batatas]
MATAITNMSGAPLPYPSHGRLRIRTITRVRMPRSSVALGHNCFEIHFNPLFHLTSLGTAFSFFWDRLAGLSTDIVFPIASFAFDLVRSRNWFYGVSLSVDLETVYVLEEPSADFLDGEMILNEDTAAVRDYYGQPFASTGHGMSQQEISMLKTERLSDDDDDGECCSICLEGFMRGMVITKLTPCSHRIGSAGVIFQRQYFLPFLQIVQRTQWQIEMQVGSIVKLMIGHRKIPALFRRCKFAPILSLLRSLLFGPLRPVNKPALAEALCQSRKALSWLKRTSATLGLISLYRYSDVLHSNLVSEQRTAAWPVIIMLYWPRERGNVATGISMLEDGTALAIDDNEDWRMFAAFVLEGFMRGMVNQNLPTLFSPIGFTCLALAAQQPNMSNLFAAHATLHSFIKN